MEIYSLNYWVLQLSEQAGSKSEYSILGAKSIMNSGQQIKSIVSFSLLALTVVSQAQFRLLVTETPAGSVGPGSWMGIRRYNVAGVGGAATIGNGVSSTMLSDPAGVTFNASGEMFVGNRHGNSGPASISRFLYNGGSDSYVANGTITGNGLTGVHGVSFAPFSGELFAANISGGISRFNFAGNTPIANGQFGGGTTRDVLISPSGQWAYVLRGVTNTIERFDLTTGAFMDQLTVTGSSGLHFGSRRGDELFVTGFGSNSVHKIRLNLAGGFFDHAQVATASTAIGLAFSPNGQEMFVAGHTSGVISRFTETGQNWVLSGTINTGVNMGELAVTAVPEPATMAVVGLGLAAMLGRRRKK